VTVWPEREWISRPFSFRPSKREEWLLDTEEEWGEEAEYSDDKDFGPSFHPILTAPDMATFLRDAQTPGAKENAARARMLLKPLTLEVIRAGNLSDGAVLLSKGPALADSIGNVADQSPTVAKTLEFLTSPGSAWVGLAMVALAMTAQFARNHEPEIQTAGKTFREQWRTRKARRAARADMPERKPAFVIRLPLGRKIRVYVPHLHVSFALRMQTVDPRVLNYQVYSDPTLLKALEKQGIKIGSDTA
jgi:hypothetical protein